jgi:hypothetical protein
MNATGKDRGNKEQQQEKQEKQEKQGPTPAAITAPPPETLETHRLPIPTWMLFSKALVPWAHGLMEVRRGWGRRGWGNHVPVPASLAEVAHESNIWLRACNHNLAYLLEDTDPDVFDDNDNDGFREFAMDMLRNPPPALLANAPGKARCEMKRAIKACDTLSRLLSDEEKAGLVTAADEEADKACSFPCPIDHGFIWGFIDGMGIFSPTWKSCSWVVWALEQVREGARDSSPHSAIGRLHYA